MSADYSVIIPTFNAADRIAGLLDSVLHQSIPPKEILVVDSASEDGTAELATQSGARVIKIEKKDFDHGGTRDMALRMTSSPIVVFMTQDALPEKADSMERLISKFAQNERIAIVGGRQIAYSDAKPFEKLVRQYNYPAVSRVWDESQCGVLGVRAYLLSDVFAAYRRDAYLAVGGFDHPLMTNEDMLITQKLLDAGYCACYAGDAAVLHSHNYRWKDQYRRNYVVGTVMERYASRFRHAQEMGEGKALAVFVMKQLIKEGKALWCIPFAIDCSARLLGNRMGRMNEVRRNDKN